MGIKLSGTSFPQIDIRFVKIFLLIVTKYISRNWLPFICLTGALSLILFLQLRFGVMNLDKSVSQGLIGTYQSHDLPAEVTRLLSKSLVEFDEEGRVVPGLASGWETNHDATVFKFRLHDNLYWSDGSTIKSSDIDFHIPEVEITYPDEQSIQFKLKEPYSPFPSLLTKPILKKETLIGTGPYKVKNVEKSRIFITKISLSSSQVDLPPLIIRFYPSEKTALIGFNLGEVQSLLGVSSQEFKDNPVVNVKYKDDYSKMVAILYNTKDVLLSNRSVRQALSYITPQLEEEVPARNSLPPFSWAYSNELKNYLSNPKEAKAAMDRAKSSVNPESLKGELILTSTPQLEETGKKVISAWRELGLDAKLRVESGIPQNFQALLIIQSIPADPDQYALWHSTQDRTNITKYSSARADKDLEDGRKMIKEEDRKNRYLDFQKVLLEDAPATFLYFPKYNIIHLKKVEDKLNKVLEIQLSPITKR